MELPRAQGQTNAQVLFFDQREWFSKEACSIPDIPPYVEKARPEIPFLDRFVVFEKTDIFLVSFLLVSPFLVFFFCNRICSLEPFRMSIQQQTNVRGGRRPRYDIDKTGIRFAASLWAFI